MLLTKGNTEVNHLVFTFPWGIHYSRTEEIPGRSLTQGHLWPGQLMIKHRVNASQDQTTIIHAPGKAPGNNGATQRSLELAEVSELRMGKRWWVEEGTGQGSELHVPSSVSTAPKSGCHALSVKCHEVYYRLQSRRAPSRPFHSP